MIEQCFGGIDVSQDRLDVLLLPQGTGFSVANDEAGWSMLIERIASRPARSSNGGNRCLEGVYRSMRGLGSSGGC